VTGGTWSASLSATFNDCEILLPPGKHVVKACYELTGGGLSPEMIKCDANRELTFDAVAGGVYRLGLAHLAGSHLEGLDR
jgi:hypothetical protein